jgi:hypothetical protein
MSCELDVIEGRIGNDVQVSLRYFDLDINDGIDLTSLTLKMGVKVSSGDTSYVVDPTSITITKQNQTTFKGWFNVLIPRSVTTTLLEQDYYTDVLVIDSSGYHDTLYEAVLSMRSKITA